MGCHASSPATYKSNKDKSPIQPCFSHTSPFTTARLYFVLEDSTTITCFTIASALFSNCSFSTDLFPVKKHKVFPSFFRTAQLPSSLYICGGFYCDSKEFSNENTRLDATFSLTACHRMFEEKCNIGLVVIDEGSFLVAGGNNEGVLASVDLYMENANEWTRKEKLNVARSGPGACFFDNRFVYIVGGCNVVKGEEKLVRTIERLDMKKATSQWAVVCIYKSDWAGGVDVGLFQCSPREIIICGGCTKDIYSLDVGKGVIKKNGELERIESFISGFCYANDRELYGFGVTGIVHSYNTRTRIWNHFVAIPDVQT